MKLLNLLQKTIEFSLYLVIFSIPISIAITNIGIGLALIFWLIKKIITKDWQFKKTSINIFLFLLLLVSLASIINSYSLISSLEGIQKLAKYLFLFFILVETMDNKEKLKRLLWAGILGLSLVSIDGIFQYFTGKDFIRGYSIAGAFSYLGQIGFGRIRASMHNPNDFACYLITFIPMVLSLFLYYAKGRKKLFLGLIFLFSFFCMFHTNFRGAGLGFLVIVILLSFIKKDLRLIIGLLIFLLILLIFLPKPLLFWLVTNPNPYDFFVEDMGRRQHWQTAINMIKKHPFLGIGINTFSISYARYKSAFDPFVGFYAHNSYLHLAGEIGLGGLLIFILMLLVIIKNWIKSYKKIPDKELKEISLSVFLGWIGFLVAGILESSLQISNLAVLFWFMTAWLTSLTKLGGDGSW